ncbi:GNAT family N-acetyltransferase [Novosphingobium sp. Leaf2]|uniref:GNAT family N-acetyltransferase n=1 Tax=Novosphingobium sp. Leaf2 TaxID=1735670 RepID=UPI000A698C20|nr:GNAT family N-acetyltransferase [Novosphingobium sp. Leaf2]
MIAAPAWRAMQADDLDGVVATARACFPDHFEALACFAERLALYPQGCLVLAAGTQVQGYCIGYPWPLGAIPPLDSLLGELPDARDAYYLHDLALMPHVRGQGFAAQGLDRLTAVVRGAGGEVIALVSVNETARFWDALGFRAAGASPALVRKLQSYGEGATYMTRAV